MTPPDGPAILLVEDDAPTRDAIATNLRAHGYRVTDVGDGEAALRAWEQRRPDVILVDLGLPGIDGLAVVEHVRGEATSPIIVPTAGGPAPGATDYEVKITLTDDFPSPRSGLSASTEIVTARREDVLAIPIQSLVVRSVSDDSASAGGGVVEREGVFVVREGEAVFVPVRVGISGDRYFEVLSGIEEGDQVVSGSYEALRDLTDGAPVKIEEAAASSEGS